MIRAGKVHARTRPIRSKIVGVRKVFARQRQKLVSQLASEKNRLHKVLTDSGIRLGVVVSDLHDKSARAMVKAIIAGGPPQ